MRGGKFHYGEASQQTQVAGSGAGDAFGADARPGAIGANGDALQDHNGSPTNGDLRKAHLPDGGDVSEHNPRGANVGRYSR
jgi:hypothetical protein